MDRGARGKSTLARIIHIGVVVRDMDKTIERLEALGIGPFKPRILPADAREKFRGKPFQPAKRVAIQITRIGNMELELIQPVSGKSPHQEFLDKKGEGIQHLGFMVDNLEEDVKRLTAAGSSTILTSQFKGGGGVAYLDLDAAGLIVELVQVNRSEKRGDNAHQR
jgi:methylmalonyl-CoA/ethylmalonyl-CoA epimerase